MTRWLLAFVTVAGAVCALAAGGCAQESDATVDLNRLTPVERRNQAAYELQRLTRMGDFPAAHALADSRAAANEDPVISLWWQCQHLYIYAYEDRPQLQAELAARLAAKPAARSAEFLLSGGLPLLFHALAVGGGREQAGELLEARYRTLLAMTDRRQWWHHRMAETAGLARTIDDTQLARAAAAQVELPPDDPYNELLNDADSRVVRPRRERPQR